MKVLAIGGSGFIGGSIVDALPPEAQTTVFDVKAPHRDDVAFVRGSIEDRDALDAAMDGHDVVLHFAATVGVVACQQDADMVMRTNVGGTTNVLELAARHSVKRLLFASSSEVYGDGVSPVFAESDAPSPKTPYGRSKVAGETLVREFAERHGIPSTVMRFFNVYGPRQREEFVVARFCTNALQGKDLELHGDGSQTRTFTYISDAVRAALAAITTPRHDGPMFDLYNVASRETVSIAHLAERIVALAESPSRIVRRDFDHASVGREPALEILHRVGDFSKLASALAYEPTVGLDEGIRRTLRWYLEGGALGSAPREHAVRDALAIG
jgi:UDP-glucose 4-epimerase